MLTSLLCVADAFPRLGWRVISKQHSGSTAGCNHFWYPPASSGVNGAVTHAEAVAILDAQQGV
jgi:hypothetical protein